MSVGENHPSIESLVDHLFRNSAGKMVSVLTRLFGSHNITLAEDVVQDTLLKAMQIWPRAGIPQNPEGWLMQVAKNRALDLIRRRNREIELPEDTDPLLSSAWTRATRMEYLFLPHEIRDDQLRLMFTCCHPMLPQESRIALTLKTLCGLGTNEIARAFLTSEETIQKRLYRAKQLLREHRIRFEIPDDGISERFDSVLHVIYLLFNEGYNTTRTDAVIRQDLMDESIRLGEMLLQNDRTNTPATQALLALMYLHAARTDARTDATGHIFLLAEQDRRLWNQTMILKGLTHLHASARGTTITRYHLEAGIAGCHATAESFAATNWDRIVQLYDLLLQMQDHPVIRLQRGIALCQSQSPQTALAWLQQQGIDEALSDYPYLHATYAELYKALDDKPSARKALTRAIQCSISEAEKHLLNDRLEKLA